MNWKLRAPPSNLRKTPVKHETMATPRANRKRDAKAVRRARRNRTLVITWSMKAWRSLEASFAYRPRLGESLRRFRVAPCDRRLSWHARFLTLLFVALLVLVAYGSGLPITAPQGHLMRRLRHELVAAGGYGAAGA